MGEEENVNIIIFGVPESEFLFLLLADFPGEYCGKFEGYYLVCV
ncbi:MAG: hypothetical protein QXR19_13470 [Candidatus Jordarchaeaceae archaeon]